MATNKQIAENVLKAVGGKENVQQVTHCMTRLRFTLKDDTIPDKEEVKKISGVMSVVVSGGQFQVVIGQNVPKVYDELCALGNFEKKPGIDEDLDKPKEKLTVKSFFGNILNGVSGCMTPLIPLLLVAGLLKMVPALFGQGVLNILSPDSDLYTLFTFLGDAGFYFLPIAIGYTGSEKIWRNPHPWHLAGQYAYSPHVRCTGRSRGGQFYSVWHPVRPA